MSSVGQQTKAPHTSAATRGSLGLTMHSPFLPVPLLFERAAAATLLRPKRLVPQYPDSHLGVDWPSIYFLEGFVQEAVNSLLRFPWVPQPNLALYDPREIVAMNLCFEVMGHPVACMKLYSH